MSVSEFERYMEENTISYSLELYRNPSKMRKEVARSLVLSAICEDREEIEDIPGVDVEKCIEDGAIKHKLGIGFYVPDLKMDK